ncbi:MAG: lactonase family protein [Chloroflexota bacterium]
MRRRSTLFTLGAAGLLAIGATGSVVAAPANDHAGAVYTLGNHASGNAVIAFSRSRGGALTPLGTYPTGGLGSGAGLGSEGSLVLSGNGHLLVAVNAGSNTITSFRVRTDGTLSWADTVASGGTHPISVTVSDDLVYALNDGAGGNIAGFRIDGEGDLDAIAGSSRPLSGSGTGPAEVAFSPHGDTLVVTEKAVNQVLGYDVREDGTTAGPNITAAAGVTPFGFAFDRRGHVIASEASGGAPGASTVSSYGVSASGHVSVIDGPNATGQGSACWATTTPDGRFAYVANTGSATVTGFAIGRDGSLQMLNANGITGSTGAAPSDLHTTARGTYLYVLNGGADSISAFRVGSDGSLSGLPGVGGLPAPGVGLAAS